MPGGNDVKVDITIREQLVYALQQRPVLRGYEEFTDLPDGQLLEVYSLEEITAEKRSLWPIARATNHAISTIYSI